LDPGFLEHLRLSPRATLGPGARFLDFLFTEPHADDATEEGEMELLQVDLWHSAASAGDRRGGFGFTYVAIWTQSLSKTNFRQVFSIVARFQPC